MNKYITEIIGTFFLIFTIGCCVIGSSTGVIAPLAIGSTLMVMVYAGGHVSGAHYNPAVTLAVWFRNKLPLSEIFPYILSQLIGAAIATYAVLYLKAGVAITPLSINLPTALLAEFIWTFALAYVVLNVATAPANDGNSFYGLAIGMTVLAGAFAVGGISGGAFNPAVTFALSLFGILSWQYCWIYICIQIFGGLLAAVVYKATRTA